MIAIDTDVLAVHHIFHNNPRYEATRDFFAKIQKSMRLGDAAILWTLESNPRIDAFITWNTKHFKDKTSIKILTPSDFL